RGFTAFAEQAQPDAVMAVLAEYHAALGELILAYEGTLERFVGDGLLVLFNDPLPCSDHSARAVGMALEMRGSMGAVSDRWRRRGYELGFGIGIAQGYATLGPIGYEGRTDYAAIGSVPNLASRLCDEAGPGQILISQRVYISIEEKVDVTPVGDLTLKGFHRPVAAYDVRRWRDGTTSPGADPARALAGSA
ncbi:MAG TPA: adenylate/guanylate cyclase domain-containing protein, partial [Beijerinckiaceae bacterium]|nr:adenylate/guanylate cyclase domain-containing protein [Beijerinckiaceae bacterium]